MKCKICGKEIKETSLVCKFCYSPIDKDNTISKELEYKIDSNINKNYVINVNQNVFLYSTLRRLPKAIKWVILGAIFLMIGFFTLMLYKSPSTIISEAKQNILSNLSYLEKDNFDNNIKLPPYTIIYGRRVDINWESSNPKLLSSEGILYNINPLNELVTLNGTIRYKKKQDIISISIIIAANHYINHNIIFDCELEVCYDINEAYYINDGSSIYVLLEVENNTLDRSIKAISNMQFTIKSADEVISFNKFYDNAPQTYDSTKVYEFSTTIQPGETSYVVLVFPTNQVVKLIDMDIRGIFTFWSREAN